MIFSLIFPIIMVYLVYRIIRWAWRTVIRGVDSAARRYDDRTRPRTYTTATERWEHTKRSTSDWVHIILAVIVILLIIEYLL
ncbi:MAG: hypothetical protein IJX99_09190 [Clostridia bacterium]|nr:hypothetical protein [Clostridia bacterium]